MECLHFICERMHFNRFVFVFGSDPRGQVVCFLNGNGLGKIVTGKWRRWQWLVFTSPAENFRRSATGLGVPRGSMMMGILKVGSIQAFILITFRYRTLTRALDLPFKFKLNQTNLQDSHQKCPCDSLKQLN